MEYLLLITGFLLIAGLAVYWHIQSNREDQ